MPQIERAHEAMKMTKFEVPGIKEEIFTTDLIFKKCRGYLESKVLLSSNCFHTNLLNSNHYKITFSNARGLGLGHYTISDMFFFLFLAFLKLQSLILWRVGHMMA